MIKALETPRREHLACVLLVVYLLLLLGLTMAPPNYVPRQRLRLVPFTTIRHQFHQGGRTFLVNVPGNVVAFAPSGILVPLWSGRLRSLTAIVFVGLITSGGIELLQLNFTRRVADIDDVILNVCGAIVGYGCYRLYTMRSGVEHHH